MHSITWKKFGNQNLESLFYSKPNLPKLEISPFVNMVVLTATMLKADKKAKQIWRNLRTVNEITRWQHKYMPA